jgi:cardiolipin synthase
VGRSQTQQFMSSQSISTVVLASHWLIVVGLSLRVIMRRPPVGVAVAWLAVILSVPFVGAVVYLLFGEKRLGTHRAAATTRNMVRVEDWQAALRLKDNPSTLLINRTAEALSRHAERVLGYPVLSGNAIELLDDFQSIFDRIVADIEAAQNTCHLGFYIWHEGGRMADVVDALVRAARRGVQCRALADAEGSKPFFESPLAARLRESGVEFRTALPTNLVRSIFARADLRNHRKILVIDGWVAYTGSQNLVDPRFFKQDSGVGEWVDAMVRIHGPAAAALDGVFQLDWAVETGRPFEPPPNVVGGSDALPGTPVQVVPSGPDLYPEAIHQLLLTAMYGAQRELVLTTPYFVPGDAILTALLSAALRGVEVTLIVPARNDFRLVRYAGVAHYDDLMSAGARIALFQDGLLHTKSLTIDGETSVFGSVNLDMRSVWLNFEISLFVFDPGFTRRLRALQNAYLARSELLGLDAWRRRPAWHRFAENTFRLLGPLL